jgi:Icc-related predicted phosphoesterase
MKICFVSDLHGRLFEIPECDVLVISGDICPDYRMLTEHVQKQWLESVFAKWIEKQKQVICTWGNHDYVGESFHYQMNISNCKFLLDEEFEFEGFNFYGSPWQRRFFDWAFNLDEPELDAAYDLIPNNVDVLITHGPVYGLGDMTNDGHVGSLALLEKIRTVKPKVSVYGHIHVGYGKYQEQDTLILNASVLNEKYELNNPAFVVEFDENKKVISCEQVVLKQIDWRKNEI